MPDHKHSSPPRSGSARAPKGPVTVYDRTLAKANEALDASREGARDLAQRASEGVQSNPFVVLVGGVAVGVLAGLVVPRSERETALLAPAGQRLSESITAAVGAAKEAGREELGAIGFGRDAARTQVKRLLEGALGAVGTAAAAAAKAPRDGRS